MSAEDYAETKAQRRRGHMKMQTTRYDISFEGDVVKKPTEQEEE